MGFKPVHKNSIPAIVAIGLELVGAVGAVNVQGSGWELRSDLGPHPIHQYSDGICIGSVLEATAKDKSWICNIEIWKLFV